MIEFVKVEERGGNLVAVFEQHFRTSESFCLNESNLRARIDNLRQDGLDTSVESVALAELIRQTKEQSSNQ